MLTKDEVKYIIGIAMLFDSQKRFDNWRGDEAAEWTEKVAEAIVNLPNNACTGQGGTRPDNSDPGIQVSGKAADGSIHPAASNANR
jgi:hypothetical protein